MKIKLLKPYLMSAKGDVIDPNEHIANALIKRKIAEAVKPKSQNKNKE